MANKIKVTNIVQFEPHLIRNLELRFGYMVVQYCIFPNSKQWNFDVIISPEIEFKKYRTARACLQANKSKVNVIIDDFIISYIPVEFEYDNKGYIKIKKFLK